MKATNVLMDEHRVIERVLGALENAAQRLDEGGSVRPGFFLDAAEFIRGFADGRHHIKEERVLFTVMAGCGVEVHGGPIGVMLDEHEQARTYTRAMGEAAQKLDAGDESAAKAVVRSAQNYCALLREHIAKEDNILFPMADDVIPEDQLPKLEQQFDEAEREHANQDAADYIALAARLEQEAAG
jgi:hemerythrin-like domain-containing protein